MKNSKIMQQAKVEAYGGPEQLILEPLSELPKPGPGCRCTSRYGKQENAGQALFNSLNKRARTRS